MAELRLLGRREREVLELLASSETLESERAELTLSSQKGVDVSMLRARQLGARVHWLSAGLSAEKSAGLPWWTTSGRYEIRFGTRCR